MEEPVSSPESACSEPAAHEVLILHAADADEWATYLQHILKTSRKFRKRSILLYAVGPADQLHGSDFECFQGCSCVVLLLSGELLDMLSEPELQAALQRLLCPPHRVVALLCGVSEERLLTDSFHDWSSWRKLSAEDEPGVYISTVLQCISEGRKAAAARGRLELQTSSSPASDEKEEVASGEQREAVVEDEEAASEAVSAAARPRCRTVQPQRVLCGGRETLFIIFTHKVDEQSLPEVEFSSEKAAVRKVPAAVENEYTLSVTAPDMPAGVASLTLHAGRSSLSLSPVTFYTHMGEVSRCLEDASDPLDFICQAFSFTSNVTESLDSMLTDSLKARIPATSFQLFGVRQIEEDNMAAYQRSEELPTLLHFAAKYGLKKLTTMLLQCPGALQAYSVMNKHGDYPNTLAEKSGFSDLRQFMDEFVETAALLKSHFEDSVHREESADVYEMMSATSQDIMLKYSGCSEDVYESMLGIDPECAEDLYEVMSAPDENPEEAMLRKFFQAKPHADPDLHAGENLRQEAADKDDQLEEEEDVYNLCPEDIYDTVDSNSSYNPLILNRPPAPIPRPEAAQSEREKPMISRVFSDRSTSDGGTTTEAGLSAAPPPALQPPDPVYDPYAGMKTPGQKQLISLQERVKVGEITVDEAVQEFKSWQFDHERRANSIRYQKENLKRLRESITRRHKERQKTGKELDYEISAPLQRNLYWGSTMTLECSVYEPAPRVVAPPPPAAAPVIQRGTWKTGSTSSNSSTESNRLSTQSTLSYSSGTEPDFEDISETLSPPPPRPPRSTDGAALESPPRIPPRVPERVPEKMLHERYVSCPTRALPQRPTQRPTDAAPPLPRRLR